MLSYTTQFIDSLIEIKGSGLVAKWIQEFGKFKKSNEVTLKEHLNSELEIYITKWQQEYPALLKQLRTEVANLAKLVETDTIEEVQIKLTAGYQTLLQKMLKEAFSLIGEPPCNYGWFGLGSYSRSEVLPYSDVEYLWLFQDMHTNTRQYFGILNELICLQIRSVNEPGGFHPDQYPEVRDIFVNDVKIQLPKTLNEIARDLVINCKKPDGLYTQILSNLQGRHIAGDDTLWEIYTKEIKQKFESLHADKKIKYSHLGEVCREIIYISVHEFEKTWKKPLNASVEVVRHDPKQDAKEGYAFFLTYFAILLKFLHHVKGMSSIEIFTDLIQKKLINVDLGKKLIESWKIIHALRYRIQLFYQEGRHDFKTSTSLISSRDYLLSDKEQIALKKVYDEVIAVIYGHLISVKKIERFFTTEINVKTSEQNSSPLSDSSEQTSDRSSKSDKIISDSNKFLKFSNLLESECANYHCLKPALILPKIEKNFGQLALCYFLSRITSVETIMLLVETGVNAIEPDILGISPARQILNWSEKAPQEAKAIWEFLFKFGVDSEERSKTKSLTLLDEAIEKDYPKTFIVLCQLGAGRMVDVERVLTFIDTYFITQKEIAESLKECILLLMQQNHYFSWRLALRESMQESAPENKTGKNQMIVVEGAITGKGYLKPDVVAQLFNAKGRINKENSNVYGRRDVVKIQIGTQEIYVKFYPELPGMEESIRAFAQQLFGYGTSQSELFRFIEEQDLLNSYSVLMSHSVKGENLQTVLNNAIEKNEIEKLDHYRFSQLVLLSLLINPEDGKPDNYIFSPYINAEGESSYQLVCVDNDHALVDALIQDKDGKRVQVKTIVYCLEQMKIKLHPKAISEFIALDPRIELNKWLDLLVSRQTRYEQLFVIEVRQRLLKSESVTQIHFPPRSISKLYERWTRLKETLESEPSLSALELLKYVEPHLGSRYQKAFEKYLTPLERFHFIAAPSYSTPIVGQYKTIVTSRQLLKTQQIQEKSLIQNDSDYGPLVALDELSKIAEEGLQIEFVLKQVQQGDFSGFERLYLNQTREAVLKDLDWSKLTLSQQKIFLKQLIEIGSFRELTFKNCEVLNDELLERLCKNSPGLKILCLVKTVNIGKDLSRIIEKYGQSLERIVLSNLVQLTQLVIKIDQDNIVLTRLKTLQVIHCPHLVNIKLETPLLSILLLDKLSALMLLSLKNSKKLLQCSISDCPMLLAEGLYEVMAQISPLKPSMLSIESCPKINRRILDIKLFEKDLNFTIKDAESLLDGKCLDLSTLTVSNKAVWQLSKTLGRLRTLTEINLHSNAANPFSLAAFFYHCANLKKIKSQGQIQLQKTFELHTSKITCLAVSPKKKGISGSEDNTLKVFDIDTGKCEHTLRGHSGGILGLDVLSNDEVISSSMDKTLKVWNIDKGRCEATLQDVEKQDCWILGVTALTKGKAISGSWENWMLKLNSQSWCRDSSVKVWDINKSCFERSLEGHRDAVTCFAELPNGKFISGSADRTLKIWDLGSGQCEGTLSGHSGIVWCVKVLPNGQVISGSWDKTLKVWDIATKRCVQTLRGHNDEIWCLAISHDGNPISGSRDGELKIWNLTTNQCERTLLGHAKWITGIAVSPDGRILSGSRDKTIKVWGGRNLTLNIRAMMVLRGAFNLHVENRIVTLDIEKTEKKNQFNFEMLSPLLDAFEIKVICLDREANAPYRFACENQDSLCKILCLLFGFHPKSINKIDKSIFSYSQLTDLQLMGNLIDFGDDEEDENDSKISIDKIKKTFTKIPLNTNFISDKQNKNNFESGLNKAQSNDLGPMSLNPISTEILTEVLKMIDWTIWSEEHRNEKQKIILKQLRNKSGFIELTFQDCATLTDELLEKLFKNSPQLKKLCLVNIIKTGKNLATLLEKYGRHIEWIGLSKLPQLLQLSIKEINKHKAIFLDRLITLQIDHCINFKNMKLEASSLSFIFFNKLPQFKKLNLLSSKSMEGACHSKCVNSHNPVSFL